MRGRSIAGQVVLILAGVILLIHNFYPELNLFPELNEYWPLLLAGAGVLHLAILLARGELSGDSPDPGAIRLPVLMIAVGALFAVDHSTRYSIARTWPALLIVVGVLNFGRRGGALRRGSRAPESGGAR